MDTAWRRPTLVATTVQQLLRPGLSGGSRSQATRQMICISVDASRLNDITHILQNTLVMEVGLQVVRMQRRGSHRLCLAEGAAGEGLRRNFRPLDAACPGEQDGSWRCTAASPDVPSRRHSTDANTRTPFSILNAVSVLEIEVFTFKVEGINKHLRIVLQQRRGFRLVSLLAERVEGFSSNSRHDFA